MRFATKVKNEQWTEIYLLRNYGSTIVKSPAQSEHLKDMRCPALTNFIITASIDELKKGAKR